MRLPGPLLLLAALALAPAVHAQQRPHPHATLTPLRSAADARSVVEHLAPPLPGTAWVPGTPLPEPPLPTCNAAAPHPAVVHLAAADSTGPAVLVGRVVFASNGGPVTHAAIRISGFARGTMSDSAGRYRLVMPALAAGTTLTVVASAPGYETRQFSVALAPGDSVTADLTLCAAAISLQSVVVDATGYAGATRSITNVQEAGVDEGDIVKLHGDHLVVLHRGRLFTVALGGGSLAPVSAVNAYGAGIDPEGTWYDEMLVSGDRVVVIGYSYERGGTEIGLFRIDAAGRLRYEATYHLRSSDYYSSRDYASRLIGSRLILYMPLPVEDGILASLPALRRWHPGAAESEFRPIAPPTHVYLPGRPLGENDGLVLHTVVTCDLARAEMTCAASAVLGPYARVFYVSPTAAYVWVSDWDRPSGRAADAMLYRLPLDGKAPSALAVEGSPVDQFSFREDGDGWLNVLVRSGARGEGMWRAERARGDVRLLRVPPARFSDGRAAAPASSYRDLPAPPLRSAFVNRFVGDYLLYGSGSGWGRPEQVDAAAVFAVRVRGGPVARVPLPHGVDRIEPMGRDAVVIGTDGHDLHFSAVALAGTPRVSQAYVSPGASQGELRSHGFFYRDDGRGGGVIGLPIRASAEPGYHHLFFESGAVLFLRNERRRFEKLGALASHPDRAEDDHCVASCVDWYGNSRPIFVGRRILALMGYELVEGAVRGDAMREVRRVLISAPARRLAESR